MTITPLAGTNQITTALTALGTTAFGDSETELYTQLLVALSAGGSGPVPPEWTPADIADLAIFLWFKEGNCLQGPPPNDDVVLECAIHYVSPLFGTSIYATSDGNPPTLRADGMELDAAGVNRLVLSSPIPGDGAFTVYWSMIYSDAQTATFLTDSSAGAYLGASTSNGVICDENFAETIVSISTNTPVLVRADCTALGGDVVINSSLGSSSGSGSGNFSMNQIGGTSGFGSFNQNTANRFRLLIWINRRIELGSAEDLLIRSWITANDGTSL